MSEALKPIVAKLEGGGALDEAEIDAAFAALMSGAAAHEDIKAFLSLTAANVADPKLIAAGARAMRARMVKVNAPADAIDVCGTGGDGAHTLNISTTVAFVLAGAGVPVAKHGNRAMSSKSGAADVLEALGVKLTHDVPTLERALREAKIAFLFAQAHHPAMRYVAQARRDLNHRTMFNLLGPLTNPAGVKKQLVGVYDGAMVKPVAEALASLGCERGWVVHGAGGRRRTLLGHGPARTSSPPSMTAWSARRNSTPSPKAPIRPRSRAARRKKTRRNCARCLMAVRPTMPIASRWSSMPARRSSSRAWRRGCKTASSSPTIICAPARASGRSTR